MHRRTILRRLRRLTKEEELAALLSSQNARCGNPFYSYYRGWQQPVSQEERFALEREAVERGLEFRNRPRVRTLEQTPTVELEKKVKAARRGKKALERYEQDETVVQAKAEPHFDRNSFQKTTADILTDHNKQLKEGFGFDGEMLASTKVKQFVPRKHNNPVPEWVKDDHKLTEWLFEQFPTVKREGWMTYQSNGVAMYVNTARAGRRPSEFQRDTDNSWKALQRMATWYEICVTYFLLQWDAASTARRITERREQAAAAYAAVGKTYPVEPLTQEQVERIVLAINERRAASEGRLATC